MRMTLLEMVQNILSATDGDEVNSIADTVESLQVAEVIKETFYELVSNLSEPTHMGVAQLQALSDPDRPNYMALPSNIRRIHWIKYDYKTDGETDYQEVSYLSPEDFLDLCSRRRTQTSTVEVEDSSGVRFQIVNDTNPSYWTSFDNSTIIFDSFDNTLDTSLMQSKTMVWADLIPTFSMTDTFIPDIDPDQFAQLLAEAKATCFVDFKQSQNPREEMRAKRQRLRRQNNLFRLSQPQDRLPNYGRARR